MKNNLKLAFLILFFTLAIAGCGQKQAEPSPEPEKTEIKEQQIYTLTDVSAHNTESDCWLVIKGKVYDLTQFIIRHPGGQAILEGCGQDATELFESRPMGSGTPHSQNARDLLKDYYVGDLD